MLKTALPGKHCGAGFSKADFMVPRTAPSLLQSLGQRHARGKKAEEVQGAAADTSL